MPKGKPTWSQHLSGGHWVTMNKSHVYVRDGDNRVVAGPRTLVGADARHLIEHHMRQPGAKMEHLPPGKEPSGLDESYTHDPTGGFPLGRAAAVHAYNQLTAQQAAKERGEEPAPPQEGLFPAFSNPLGSTPHPFHARPSYPPGMGGGPRAASTPQERTSPAPSPPVTPAAAPSPPEPAAPEPAAATAGPDLEPLRAQLTQAHDDVMEFASALQRWYPDTAWDDLPEEDKADFETLKGTYQAARMAFLDKAPPGDYDLRGQPEQAAEPVAGSAPAQGAEPPAAPTAPSPAAPATATAPPAPAPRRAFDNPNNPQPLRTSPPAALPPTPVSPQEQALGAQQQLAMQQAAQEEGSGSVERRHAAATAPYFQELYPQANIMGAGTTRAQIEAVGDAARGTPEEKAGTVERVGKMVADKMAQHGYDTAVRQHLQAHTADVAGRLRAQAQEAQGTEAPGGDAPPEEEAGVHGPSGHPVGPSSSHRLTTGGEDVGDDYLADLRYRDPGNPNSPAANRRRRTQEKLQGRLRALPAEGAQGAEGEPGEQGEVDLGESHGVQTRHGELESAFGMMPGQGRVRRRKLTPREKAAHDQRLQEQSVQSREKYERDTRADWLHQQHEPVDDPERQNHLAHLDSEEGHAALHRALEGAIPRARAQAEMEYQQRLSGTKRARDRERVQRLHEQGPYRSKQEGDFTMFRNLLRDYGRTGDPQERVSTMMALDSRARAGHLRGLPLGEAPPATGPGLRQQHLDEARDYLSAHGDPRALPGQEGLGRSEALPPHTPEAPPQVEEGDATSALHHTPEGRAKLRGLVEGTFARHDIENDLHRRMLADLAGRLHKENAGAPLDAHDHEAIKSLAGMARPALERTRQGAPGRPAYQPDHSLTGHKPYRQMVGERPGEPGAQALDDLVYQARKDHDRAVRRGSGEGRLSDEQHAHLKRLSSALYRLKNVRVPHSEWGRAALREVHNLLPGAEAYLNRVNPEHEPHRQSLQRLADYVHASDPEAPSLSHLHDMMGQHGGALRLPTGAAAPEEPGRAPSAAGSPGAAEAARAPHAARGGLLDDVLGNLATEMGGEQGQATSHPAGGSISAPVEPRARPEGPPAGGARPETLAAGAGGRREEVAPRALHQAGGGGLLDDVLARMAGEMGGAEQPPAQVPTGAGAGTAPEVTTEPSGQTRIEPPAQPGAARPVFGQTPPPRKGRPTAGGAPLREPGAGEGGLQPGRLGPSQQRQQQQEAQGFLFGNMGQRPEGTQLGFGDRGPTEEKATGPVQTGFLDLPPAAPPAQPPAKEPPAKEPPVGAGQPGSPMARKEPGFIDRAAAALRNAEAERQRAKGAAEEKEAGPVQAGFVDLTPPTTTEAEAKTSKGPSREERQEAKAAEEATQKEEAKQGEGAPSRVQTGFIDLPPVEQEQKTTPAAPKAEAPKAEAPKAEAPKAAAGPARFPEWDEALVTRRLPTQVGRSSPLERVPQAQQQEHATQHVRNHVAEHILRGGVQTLPPDEEDKEERSVLHPSEQMPFMYTGGVDLPARERHAANVMWHRAGTPAEQVAMLARYAHGFAPHLGRPPEPRDPMNPTPAEREASRKWAVRSARFVRSTLDRMMAHFVPGQTGAGRHTTNQISPMQARRYRQLSDALLWHAQNEGRLPDHKEFAKLYGASESGRVADEEDPINHAHVERQLQEWRDKDHLSVAQHAAELHRHALVGHTMADGRPGHPPVGPNTLHETAKRLGALAEHKRVWDPDDDLSDQLLREYGSADAAAMKAKQRELSQQARRKEFLDHPEHGPVNPGTLAHVSDRLGRVLSGDEELPRAEEPEHEQPAAAPEQPEGADRVNVAALERGAQVHAADLAGEGASLEEAGRLSRTQSALRQQDEGRRQLSQSPHVQLVRSPHGHKELYDQAEYAYKHTSEPQARLRLGLLSRQLHEIANDPTLSDEERGFRRDQVALGAHGLDEHLEEARRALQGKAPTGPPVSPEEHGRNTERRARGLRDELREVDAHLKEVGDGPLVPPARKGDRKASGGRNWRLYDDADLHAVHLEGAIGAMRRAKADHPVVKEAEERLAKVYANFLRHRIAEAGTTTPGRARLVRYELDHSQRKMAALRPDHPLLKEAQAARDRLDDQIGEPLGAEDLRKERKKSEQEAPYERALREWREDRARRGVEAAGPPPEETSPAGEAPQAAARQEPAAAEEPRAEGKVLGPDEAPQAEGKILAPEEAPEGPNAEHVEAIVQRAQGLERGDLQRQIDAFSKVAERGETIPGHGGTQVTPQTAAEAGRRLEELRDQLEAGERTLGQQMEKSRKLPAPKPEEKGGRTAAQELGAISVGTQLETPQGRMWVSAYHPKTGVVRGEVNGALVSLNLNQYTAGKIQRVGRDVRESGWINPLIA